MPSKPIDKPVPKAETTQRLCTSCNQFLKLDKFELYKKNGAYRGVCRACVLAQRARKTSTTPEAYLKVVFIQLRSFRVRQGIEFVITEEDVCEIWESQGGRCALSGVLMTHHRDGAMGGKDKKEFNASIDRINPSGIYSRENVQLVANRINTMKHILGEEMFLWWVRNVYEHSTR
jgi:hypothetical protein|tara:strand:- start:278 stop:802 length:525 start_codon:yes stop_codon:yes gene_type:complete